MNENLRTAAIEGEAPVNPYSLLEAVNNSGRTAHRSWIVFLAVLSYLLVVVASVTDADLLLSRPVALPLLRTEIGLEQFFFLAPILFVVVHIGMLTQLVLVARKAQEFDQAIRMLEVTDRRTHPLRLELHTFLPVQLIAGYERSRLIGAVLHAMVWLTLVILPLALLLYVQVAFLPYHHVALTWLHRAVLLADVLMLILIGVFLLRPETSLLRALGAAARHHPIGLVVFSAALGLVMAFSLLVATVPGEPLDRVAQAIARPHLAQGGEPRDEHGFLIPFLGGSADGSLLGLFARNLRVAGLDLESATSPRQRPSLRGRDLRFARLDRTSLRNADLTGANLDGASLVGTDLSGALLECADIVGLSEMHHREAARCTSARGANLAHALLDGARMAGIDLTGARLDEARLDGADLRHATLTAASFQDARLRRANLTDGVSAPGASFAGAMLQGADATGAWLAGSNFTGAGLQGAVFVEASLVGANLRDTDLQGADLRRARLHGASLRGAKVRAADMRTSALWRTAAPDRDFAELADMSGLVLAPLEEGELAKLKAALDGIGRGRELAAAALSRDATRPWIDAADQQTWQALGTASAAGSADNYKGRLTEHLARLACNAHWSDGSVAAGLARRALARDFKGDLPALYDRLKGPDCPASKTMPPADLNSLAAAAEQARGN